MSEITVLSTDELGEIPRPHWLIEDMVAEKSTTMIYGPWGLGKSFMTLDMVLAASTGAPWHGRKVDRPLKTLFIVAEGAAWWYRRVLAYEREHGDGAVDRDNILWIPQPVDMYHPMEANLELRALEAIIAEHRPDILVIDTWVRCSAAYGMNEDKAMDTAQAYKNIDYLRDRYDVAPIIVHHPTKQGKARGSGNQEASVERVIALHEVEGASSTFEVRDEKGNHIEPFAVPHRGPLRLPRGTDFGGTGL
jgi:RecA-family ATPase